MTLPVPLRYLRYNALNGKLKMIFTTESFLWYEFCLKTVGIAVFSDKCHLHVSLLAECYSALFNKARGNVFSFCIEIKTERNDSHNVDMHNPAS